MIIDVQGNTSSHKQIANLFRWPRLLFLGYLAVLMYGLFRPTPPPELFEESDKVLHLLAFGALALSSQLAFPGVHTALFWSLLFTLGPVLEWAQHWLQPARMFSLEDALANVMGAVAGGMAWGLWRLRRAW